MRASLANVMRGVQPSGWALNILSVSLASSALARGIDFIISPDESAFSLTVMGRWMSPNHLGFILVALSALVLIGAAFRSSIAQTIGNIGLAAVFLVMGVISFLPTIWEIGWGWRAPVSYVLGGAVVHWFVAHEWYNKWVEARGRHRD